MTSWTGTDPICTAAVALGLTLARRIAEEHGGSVCLEESIQESTAFTLNLTKRRLLALEELKSGVASENGSQSSLRERMG